MEDTYSRFSQVVENYIRYRPSYPPELMDLLKAACGLSPSHIVADIGAGTGLLTELFLKNGNRVYGVEPNAEMRAAAEHHLRAYSLFTSLAATAEATTLADHSVQLITAGQAFHWFKPEPTRQEFWRILAPTGWVVLVWNVLRTHGTVLAVEFGQFWQKYIDPHVSEPKRLDSFNPFFGAGNFKLKVLDNYQVCDFAALKGRVLSASSAPQAHHPQYPAMMGDLTALFNQCQENGTVRLEYETQIVYGQLSA